MKNMDTTLNHLQCTLEIAVPLWALKVRKNPDHYLSRENAERILKLICEDGDALMFRRKGKTAEVFNAVAESIAILSFCPGGVHPFGLHFDNSDSAPWREGGSIDDKLKEELINRMTEFLEHFSFDKKKNGYIIEDEEEVNSEKSSPNDRRFGQTRGGLF